jgi:effector-binding domain-containing protein
MKKVLKFLLYLVGGIAGLVLLLGIFAKKNYHIERSIELDANPTAVFDYVRYFKNFDEWSPWSKLDPNMKTSVEGTDGAVGATYRWDGNDDAGKGTQTITSLTGNSFQSKLVFTEPFESESLSKMDVVAAGTKTKVVWTFDMVAPFPLNGLMMFADMDKAIGKDYEMGLENLKNVFAKRATMAYNGYNITVEDQIPVAYYMGKRAQLGIDALGKFMASTMPMVSAAAEKTGASTTGSMSALVWSWDEATMKTDMAITVPFSTQVTPPANMEVFTVGGGKALVAKHIGNTDKTGAAHEALDAYMAANGLKQINPVIEEYLTDPSKEPDTAKWVTKIIYFVEPK